MDDDGWTGGAVSHDSGGLSIRPHDSVSNPDPG